MTFNQVAKFTVPLHNTVCCPYCGSVDPFGYYRNTDRIVTILLALIIVVLLTTVSVSVCILCSW
ncbi:hypothetical protein [Escherichia coli]|uniref:hypothetical protein n=1 Tax=Escherichia coli TaxID=562 RepID=UPI00090761A3|nr:hypothetical protein [Escherichia coli]